MLTRLRIWLPDAPGVLGAVAAEIGAVHGNVVGLEVLEREAGVAIDEMVVELPDDPDAIDAVCRAVRNVPGVGVEEVTELAGEAADREDTVLAAASAIVEVHGYAPSPGWVAAFAEGARSGADPANDTTGSGVFVEVVSGAGLTLCGGRTVAIRRRERREIALLVTVAARFIDALGGR